MILFTKYYVLRVIMHLPFILKHGFVHTITGSRFEQDVDKSNKK